MNIQDYLEQAAQVSVAFVLGAILGVEREFRSKPAGFRTMILISVGSCLYTILSKDLGGGVSSDRIASNIVTGIGFIGAGVIFKEGVSVNGLTTAALIWITAALGMAIGNHNYPVAFVVTIIVVLALFVLEPVQRFINRFHKVKDYKIRVQQESLAFKADLEVFLQKSELSYRCMKITKENHDAIYTYIVLVPETEIIN